MNNDIVLFMMLTASSLLCGLAVGVVFGAAIVIRVGVDRIEKLIAEQEAARNG